MGEEIYVDKDIKLAETLPAKFYKNKNIFEITKEKIFLRCWHWIGDNSFKNEGNFKIPIEILPKFLNEPLVLTITDENKIKCFSNVCTHRGNILVHEKCKSKKIICNYHGRRFNGEGKFEFMPEFKETLNFPRESDHLHDFPIFVWNKLIFVGLNPSFSIDKVFEKINRRVSFLPLENLQLHEDLSKDYSINANWALYCDNYLEGFHVPFVHKDLNEVLDYNSYDTEIDEYFNLQIGYAKNEDECFTIPKKHKDYGKKIAAYYYWLFPNLMLNIYPWGISINLVCPEGISKTKILFRSYVFDKSKLNSGASGDLDKVEMEDEEVVQSVQKGINSSFYNTGRFSPTKEKGVHHFHSLISKFFNDK
tara:strand:+ start:294 stop:1385 length:1092 start_codon:yes stop_codon:yes gene_type:complete